MAAIRSLGLSVPIVKEVRCGSPKMRTATQDRETVSYVVFSSEMVAGKAVN